MVWEFSNNIRACLWPVAPQITFELCVVFRSFSQFIHVPSSGYFWSTKSFFTRPGFTCDNYVLMCSGNFNINLLCLPDLSRAFCRNSWNWHCYSKPWWNKFAAHKVMTYNAYYTYYIESLSPKQRIRLGSLSDVFTGLSPLVYSLVGYYYRFGQD